MADPQLFAEPVIGYRQWRISNNDELKAFGGWDFAWEPGVNTAVCMSHPSTRDHPDHTSPPDPGCHCGLYAWHEPIGTRATWGAIAAWGRIQVHPKGFRAEHAQVLALTDFHGPARIGGRSTRRVAERYGVPYIEQDVPVAVVIDTVRAIAEEHGSPLPAHVVPEYDPPPPKPVNLTGQTTTTGLLVKHKAQHSTNPDLEIWVCVCVTCGSTVATNRHAIVTNLATCGNCTMRTMRRR